MKTASITASITASQEVTTPTPTPTPTTAALTAPSPEALKAALAAKRAKKIDAVSASVLAQAEAFDVQEAGKNGWIDTASRKALTGTQPENTIWITTKGFTSLDWHACVPTVGVQHASPTVAEIAEQRLAAFLLAKADVKACGYAYPRTREAVITAIENAGIAFDSDAAIAALVAAMPDDLLATHYTGVEAAKVRIAVNSFLTRCFSRQPPEMTGKDADRRTRLHTMLVEAKAPARILAAVAVNVATVAAEEEIL